MTHNEIQANWKVLSMRWQGLFAARIFMACLVVARLTAARLIATMTTYVRINAP